MEPEITLVRGKRLAATPPMLPDCGNHVKMLNIPAHLMLTSARRQTK
jgi:hypothetical protein